MSFSKTVGKLVTQFIGTGDIFHVLHALYDFRPTVHEYVIELYKASQFWNIYFEFAYA